MPPLFQPIAISDVPLLMPIEQASHGHPWTEKTMASCIGGRYFGQLLKLDSTVVGFYIGEYIAGEATLMNICVVPNQQGNGYGKKLLHEFIREAKQKTTTKLFLEVRASNISAQMLYINAGFNQIGRRTGYYPKTVGFEDAIVMSKPI